MDPLDRVPEARGTPDASRAGRVPPQRPIPRPPADALDISPEAVSRLEIHETVTAVRQAASAVPEVRPERVAEARTRIEQGYYERPDVRGSIVEALLRTFHDD